ncbi:hypothetical protein IH601_03935 [Candidatus Bipolaricaulota bacterium]|nr:hypothetical protein [Candidatus Bipolaricaulota bacterium]
MSIQDHLLRDELKREPAVAGEIGRLLEGIDRRLHDAANASNYPETRLEQAYHAILGCALAALRTQGLRPTDRPGHHIVILESLADTIGIPLSQVDYFQSLRTVRNRELYTGSTHVSRSQAEEAIAEAVNLRSDLKKWLEGQKTD